MSQKEEKKIIAIDGGKKRRDEKKLSEMIHLKLGDDDVFLSSFVLSGEDSNGKRVVLTWNTSVDDLINYTKILDVVVTEKIKEVLDT